MHPINEIKLSGSIYYDIKLQTTNNNNHYLINYLMVKQDNFTDFIRVKAWNSTALYINQNFKKGDKVNIIGRLKVQKINKEKVKDKNYLNDFYFVLVDNISRDEPETLNSENNDWDKLIDDWGKF